MNEKVPTFRKQLTPGGDTPARVEGHSLTSKSIARLAQPQKGLGDSTGDRVQSGWVGGQKQLPAVLDHT